MDNKNYYEAYDWSVIHRSSLDPIIRALQEVIPPGVSSIIDIGCGNGIITAELSRSYKVLGVDRSEAALALLPTDKIAASCDSIPVEDGSFDLVLSTELLEHLEEEVFRKTLEEFRRISRRYILVTIPNDENLQKFLLKCPGCGYEYNRSYHLRSFTKEAFLGLFPGFTPVSYRILGTRVRDYRPYFSMLKRKYAPPSSWIPLFWTPEGKRKSMCPRCELSFEYPYRRNLFALGLDLANVLLSSKKPYWQMALFAKNDGK